MIREPGTPYKRNAAMTQFNRSMEREGKTLFTYTDGQEFKAFFRIKQDNENQKETIVIYYNVKAPMRPGTLVTYGNAVFLALNKETIENDSYYKSTLVRCNGQYNKANTLKRLPFYTDNMKSHVSIGNQTISMLNGNIEMITEENILSKEISINDEFNEFSRTFKITNKYIIDGIVHFVAEVTIDKLPDDDPDLGNTPESEDFGDTTDENVIATISGSKTLKHGLPKTWSVSFTKNNTDITDSINYIWNVANCDFADSIKRTISGNTIKLQVESEYLINRSFTLQIITGENIMASIEILISPIF